MKVKEMMKLKKNDCIYDRWDDTEVGLILKNDKKREVLHTLRINYDANASRSDLYFAHTDYGQAEKYNKVRWCDHSHTAAKLLRRLPPAVKILFEQLHRK